MIRKILVSAVIATVVFTAGSAVYAQAGRSAINKDVAPAFEWISETSEAKTWESEYIIEANASEGTSIKMKLYWFNAGDGKGIMAKKKDSLSDSKDKGNWLLQDTSEWAVGSSGIIAEPVTLYLGRNRIVLDIMDVAGNKAQETLEIELTTKEEANETVSGGSMKKLIKDISSEANTGQSPNSK